MLVNPFLQSMHSSLFSNSDIELLWSADTQMRHYINYQTAWTHALAKAKIIDEKELQAAIEKLTTFKPDVQALHNAIARDGVAIPELVRQMRIGLTYPKAIHDGSTSQDVIDTALSLTINEINLHFEHKLKSLISLLDDLTSKFGNQKLTAATRMQDALEICVSRRVENWCLPLNDLVDELNEHLFPLQMGGAVGDNQGLGENALNVLSFLAEQLGLELPTRSWQTDRQRIIRYAGFLARLSGALGKIGQDICLMAYKNEGEIKLANSGGSSAMPNKQNPVSAELLVTFARYNAGQNGTITQSLIHEQERSGSAWMLEWMILPVMTLVASNSIKTAEQLIRDITSFGK